jgi:lactoylglutathione lyase
MDNPINPQPPHTPMTHLDHCGVYVKDLEKSLTFYKDIFAWKEKTRFASGEAKIAVLDMGKGLLELVQRPGSPGTPPAGNWTHLAIHVDDWHTKVKKLEAMGLELRKVTMNGANIAFFKDPDGHTLEIMEKGLSI